MKKSAISFVLVATMVATLVGCGGGSGSGSGESSGGNAGSSEASGNKLSVYAWDASFNIPALEAAAADYKANVNPDFELEIIEQSGSKDVETAIKTAASAGNFSTLPDIVLFQDHGIQSYVSDYPDAWVDINDADINWNDFSAEKISYSTIDGVHYGVPVDNGTVVSAYRIDLLEQAGYTIDDLTGCSWAEFIEIGEAVYNATGKYLLCMDGDGNDLVYIMLQAEGASQFKDGVPYLVENETFVAIMEVIEEMLDRNVLYLANSWSDYTDQAIQGDMVAGVMNGNWIIPTIEKVDANSGKWEITSMPTLNGGGGYASNGGSSLYITANCGNVDLAKDFLAKTFGGSTVTYDGALTDGGVISTYAPAGKSDVYQQGVAFFNDTPIYSQIVEMGTHVAIVEQNDYHYTARQFVAAAIINIHNGADPAAEIQSAEDQIKFAMGL